MNILIIGSKGFIGQYLANYFSSQNHSVVGVDNVIPSKNEKYTYHHVLTLNYNINCIIEDFKPDKCFFAGGSANVQLSINQPSLDFDSNVTSVSKLLEAIKNINPKCVFVHFSSAAVYGNPKTLPVKENQELSPVSPYGWHKLQAEMLCKEYSLCFGMQTVSVRPFSVYGPEQKKLLFWDLYQKIISNPDNIELFGSGNETRDFIYIDDLVDAVSLISDCNNLTGDVYNIASGEEVSIKQIATTFIRELELNSVVKFNGIVRRGDPINWKADITKLKLLGYDKKTNLESGIKKYCQWLKEKK